MTWTLTNPALHRGLRYQGSPRMPRCFRCGIFCEPGELPESIERDDDGLPPEGLTCRDCALAIREQTGGGIR